jgi:hypothetical protein
VTRDFEVWPKKIATALPNGSGEAHAKGELYSVNGVSPAG